MVAPTQNTRPAWNTAADIANQTLQFIRPLCQPGASIKAIITACHHQITKLGGKQAFPCSISVNQCLCHCSPAEEEEDVVLKEGDVAKVEFGVRVDEYPALICTTIVVGQQNIGLVEETKKATKQLIEQLTVGSNAIEAVTRLHQSCTIPEQYSYIEGMMSHRLQPKALSTDDILVIKPVQGQLKMVSKRPFSVGDVWAIDVAVSSHPAGTTKPATNRRTTIYAKSGSTAPLRLLSSRQRFSKTTTEFGYFGFNVDQFGKGMPAGKARAAVQECVQKGVLIPYDGLEVEGEGAVAARFLATVMLTDSGPIMLTDPF